MSETFEAVKIVERAVTQLLLPFRDRFPPSVLAIALARSLRVVIRMAPAGERKALLDAVVPYVEGRLKPRVDQTESGLYLPN